MNIIIVESLNDQYFLKVLIEKMNLSSKVRTTPVCIDDFKCLNGDSSVKLKAAIDSISKQAKKQHIPCIGVILDQDNKQTFERLEQVNQVIKELFNINYNLLNQIGEFKSMPIDEDINITFGLYLQNIDGAGNLETVLKKIKNKSSIHADCLSSWRECIESKNSTIKNADFDKFWVNVYIRYDQCTKKEQKQSGRKCNNQISMTKSIWDFDHPKLENLKTFLSKIGRYD